MREIFIQLPLFFHASQPASLTVLYHLYLPTYIQERESRPAKGEIYDIFTIGDWTELGFDGSL